MSEKLLDKINYPADLRELKKDQLEEVAKELRSELMNERGVASMGGQPTSPGRMRALKKQIARLTTIMREIELEREA